MRNDARLLELEFLSLMMRRERKFGDSRVEVSQDQGVPHRDMIVHLLVEGMVNDVAGLRPWSNDIDEMTRLVMEKAEYERNRDLVFLLDQQKISVRISHKGRIRLAELEQSIKTGREREEFGILWAGRYWERDLRIALLSVSKESPVACCFLDMNGLKAINDNHPRGHEAGDDAMREYLRAIADNIEGVGDAYRCGGDEVVVILPGTNADTAGKLMAALLKQLGEEKIHGIEKLTASCGVGVATDPDQDPKALRTAVDAVQYKAKEASKAGPTRRSVLAIEGRELVVF